jgi:hypothetical protein
MKETYYSKHKEQIKEYQKRYRETHKEKCKERRRVWKQNNREHVKEYQSKWLLTPTGKLSRRKNWDAARYYKYGISSEQFVQMSTNQNNKCAICNKTFEKR